LRQEAKPWNICTTVISPGAVATELPQSTTEPDIAERIRKVYETAMPADSFARTVVFAISQPDEVDINEILFRPRARNTSGPIPTEASLRSGESAHQNKGSGYNLAALPVGLYPLAEGRSDAPRDRQAAAWKIRTTRPSRPSFVVARLVLGLDCPGRRRSPPEHR
jgi:hypothetical protein